MSTKKMILWGVLVAAVLGGGYGYYEFSRGHKDLSTQTADVTIPAADLIKQFSDDETAANTKYLNKAVAVTGKIKSIEKDETGNYTVFLGEESDMSSVACQMDERHNASAEKLQVGSSVTAKGVCTGYLMDVVLIRSVIE